MRKDYGYDVESSLRYLEESYMEGERFARIMRLETHPNTRQTYQIGLDMLYQPNINVYIKRIIEFKKNSSSHTHSSESSSINSPKK